MIDGITFVRDIEVKCKNSGTIDFYYTTANYKNQKLEEILKNLFVFDGVLHCYIDSNEDRVKKITLKGIGKKVRIFDIKEIAAKLYHYNEIVFENVFFICQNNFNIMKLFYCFSRDVEEAYINLDCDLLFKKCTFTINDKSRISNITFNKTSFQDCRFMEDIHFQYCTFTDTFILENSLIHSFSLKRKQVYFSNCSYYTIPNIKGIKNRINYIDLSNGSFNINVNFDDSEILDHKIKVSFTGSEFHKNVIFNNEPMRNVVYRNQMVKTRLFYSDIEFMSVKFHKDIDLSSVTFFNKVDFKFSQFLENLVFGEYNFHKHIEESINFWECKFYKNINLTRNDVEVGLSFDSATFFGVARFNNNNFNKSFSIIDAIFHKEVYFDESKFREFANFSDAIFNENIYLLQAKFFKDVKFDKARVYKNIDFYNALFGSNVSFKSTEFKSFINFNSVKFKNIPILGAALIHPNTPINIAYMDIEKTEIEEINNSLDVYSRKSDLSINQMALCFFKDRLLTLTSIRETCRIFKDILLKENNVINATAYKKIELYINELEYFYKDNPKLNSFYDIEMDNISSLKLRDKIDWWFLKLNRTTSDHHTDFLKILLFTLSVIGGYFIANLYNELFVYDDKFFYILPSFVFLAFLSGIFIVSKKAKKIACSWYLMSFVGLCGIFYSPSIITPFLGAFSEDARNHYLYKAIDGLDSQKALDLSKQILAKEPTSELNAKKILKDYKDELKSSDLLDKTTELKRAVAIDGGVSRLNIAYYLVLAFCIFALQKTMRKNSIIPS